MQNPGGRRNGSEYKNLSSKMHCDSIMQKSRLRFYLLLFLLLILRTPSPRRMLLKILDSFYLLILSIHSRHNLTSNLDYRSIWMWNVKYKVRDEGTTKIKIIKVSHLVLFSTFIGHSVVLIWINKFAIKKKKKTKKKTWNCF